MVRVMYNSRLRNMEIPENLFSNMGEMKSKNLAMNNEKSNIEFDDFGVFNSGNKYVNYADKSSYRTRIGKMYDDLNDIKPVDSQIDNILTFDNYIEKGIVVKPKVSSLNQFWTEYRLMNNEKKIGFDKKVEISEDAAFDSLFEKLSVRVQEINRYIGELKEMRDSIAVTSRELEKDKEKLINERQMFYDYKTKEENKLKEERENLKINFSRLQTIIDDLDKKLEDFEKE